MSNVSRDLGAGLSALHVFSFSHCNNPISSCFYYLQFKEKETRLGKDKQQSQNAYYWLISSPLDLETFALETEYQAPGGGSFLE